MTIEGNDSVELAQKFGTPLWVVSEATIRNNLRMFKRVFEKNYPKVRIVYASKANHSPAIIRIVAQEGAWVDTVSLGHLRLATLAGVPPGKIVFNGNNKSETELETAVEMGIGAINVDSLDELETLSRICKKIEKVANINIRLRGSYAKSAEKDAAFVKDNTSESKFGIDIPSGQAFEACRRALTDKFLNLRGLHHHVGWTAYPPLPYNRDLDLIRIKNQVEEVVDFALQVNEKLGFAPSVLDLGGGFRKTRPQGFGPNRVMSMPDLEEYADTILDVITDMNVSKTLGQPELWFEPGGFMVTDAVTLLSTVGTIKMVESGPGKGKWVAVDSSAYLFVRKLIFNFYHNSIIANKALEPLTEIADIVGPICTYDNVGDKVRVPRLERGDVVATLDQGSYCETISTKYCAYLRPATVLVNKERADIITARETLDEYLAQYRLPTWLSAP
jgi:diaminopimelate decarboxylase